MLFTSRDNSQTAEIHRMPRGSTSRQTVPPKDPAKWVITKGYQGCHKEGYYKGCCKGYYKGWHKGFTVRDSMRHRGRLSGIKR